MKHYAFCIFLVLIVVSCGKDSRQFKVDGRLLNLNQGEFYVYSNDGIIAGMDTIKVSGGRFSYNVACETPATLMIVFPNFYEQPIFAEPGESVDVKGDASQLKVIEVKGTEDNELMTKFRQRISQASTPEIVKEVEQFVTDNPKSIVGKFLVSKYLLQTPKPNLSLAKKLIALMIEHQPREGSLIRLQKKLADTQLVIGQSLPNFSVKDLNGTTISNKTLSQANVSVIAVWTGWSFESMSMIRQLSDLQRKNASKLKILGISLDGNIAECKQSIQHDSIRFSTICDGEMYESSLIKQLGLSSVPDNIILQNGKIVARSLATDELISKLQSLL